MEISGERARLLGVDERAQHLFGREELEGAQSGRKKKATQIDLLCISRSRGWRRDLVWAGGRAAGRNNPRPVASVDDPFRRRPWGAAEAVLVEEGVGQDSRFWRLAQALSALFPAVTEEKRWVDGVLARKKSLGL